MMERRVLSLDIATAINRAAAKAHRLEREALEAGAAAAAALPEGLLDEGDLVALIRGIPQCPRKFYMPWPIGMGKTGFQNYALNALTPPMDRVAAEAAAQQFRNRYAYAAKLFDQARTP